jgi:hypothetical protein
MPFGRAARALIAGALLLLALSSPPVAAQERTPTPSAEELWQTYPLEPSPTPSAVRTAASQPEPRPAEHSNSGASIVLLAILALVATAGAMSLLRHRRTASGPAGTMAGDRSGSASALVVPPELDRTWVATLEWRHIDGEARFCVVARHEEGEPGAVLAGSDPLEWPPTGPASVHALTQATEALEHALLTRGWKPLPPGRAWYAKRFSWEAQAEPPRNAREEKTRAGLFRLAAAGGAVVAGGAVIGSRDGDGLLAAPSADADAKILNFFLLLEYVQEAFYREALRSAGLTGELEQLARTVGSQESEHVAFLTQRLAGRARARPRTSFGEALSTPERFRATAIDLEETAIGAYIGQGANLTRGTVRVVGTVLSVEARQAAWLLDLAGDPPAPHAADPARKPAEVIAHLRGRGFIA